MIGNSIYHNNRADNIRKLLYRDQTLSNKFLKFSDCNLLSFQNKDIEFFRDEKVDISSFKILESLGEGSFGKVYLVEHSKNKKKFAMKVLNKHKILSRNLISYIITERKILELIKHPFIVQLLWGQGFKLSFKSPYLFQRRYNKNYHGPNFIGHWRVTQTWDNL